MRIPLLLSLIVSLLIASALAMLLSAGIHSGPIRSGNSDAASREAVRTYYAAVESFLASGDPLLIRQTLAPELLPTDGTQHQREDLERFLLAVRETYPSLRIDVLSIVSAGEKILAEIEIHRGAPSRPHQFTLPIADAPERVVEMFDIAAGKISQRWSSWTGLGLYAPYPAPPIDVTLAPGQSLALARIDVAEGGPASFGIPGEALVMVDQGQLRIDRPGKISLYRASSSTPVQIDGGAAVTLATGEAVVLHDWNTVVSTTGEGLTTLLAAVTTPSRGDYADHGQAAGSSLFDQALKSPHGMELGELVRVTTLARSENVDGWQQAQLSSNLLMLSPGSSATIRQTEGEILVAATDPAARLEQRPDATGLVVTNGGQDLLSVWTVDLRPVT